ncbi:hypothetical protein FACS189492_0550 [Clostridia bacterium]|nr:hypothetical protein FACS189492_0550 [Clostridia bacterium]
MKRMKSLVSLALTAVLTVSMLAGLTSTAGAVVSSTAADNYFEYDDGATTGNAATYKKHGFYLLETKDEPGDDGSKFYVLSQRTYARAPIDSTTGQGWHIMRFDSELTSNVMQRMNSGDLLTAGVLTTVGNDGNNAFSNAIYSNFPAAVRNYAVNHSWATEKSTNISNATTPNEYEVAEPYNFTAKLSVISHTEFQNYFGNTEVSVTNDLAASYLSHNRYTGTSGGNDGVLFRTSSGYISSGWYMWAFSTNNSQLYSNALCTANADKMHQIKPVMWLNRDFFKSVHLNVSNMGANVKSMLLNTYKKYELSSLYSSDELVTIGFGSSTAKDNYFVYDDGQGTYSGMENVSRHGFYLLDTAASASDKFFVLSERSYALAPIDTATKSITFDPAVTTNVAYGMNTGNLLTNGVTDDTLYTAPAVHANFPTAVKTYAANHTWLTEKSSANQIAPSITSDYTKEARLTILSKTEYATYIENSGFKEIYLGYNLGTESTPVIFRSSIGYGYDGYFMWGYRNTTNAVPEWAYQGNIDQKYQIKPVMWLGDDFFKNVKLDVGSMGENVKDILTDVYTKDDLDGLYSEVELWEIGFGDVRVDIVSKGVLTDGATSISSVVRIKNTSDTAMTTAPTIIAALYDSTGNALKAVSVLPIEGTIGVGKSTGNQTITLSDLTDVSATDILRLYVWDSLSNMRPLSKAR